MVENYSNLIMFIQRCINLIEHVKWRSTEPRQGKYVGHTWPIIHKILAKVLDSLRWSNPKTYQRTEHRELTTR
jgi:hypothetical protein